ncbi:MAG: hypothetical protein L0228_20045 [Planctomycetes bacterium]|nr:hypothetical protein [Planctomycetota bacterium]
MQFAVLLLTAPAICEAAIRVEAYRGEPFGIGRVSIDLPQGTSPANDDRFALTESDDRLLYPVLNSGSAVPVRQLLRSFLDIETPSRATFYFMFRSDEPLRVTAYTPDAQEFTIRPEDDPEEYNELLDDWWDETSDRFQDVFQHAEYPVLVENYLTATWARRLDQPMPTPSRQLFGRFRIGQPWVSQLLANEAYHSEVERDLLLGRFGAGEQATLALPKPRDGEVASDFGELSRAATGESELPTPNSKLPPTIEPLAAHVPQECFYLRFGNFPNYLWFRDFLRHWQGDLGNMIVRESVDYDNSERFQKQIAVGESKLARVMGPTVIRDVAIIGLDMYLRDGAAMGILFQANNNMLLGRNLNGQRQDAKGKFSNAKEETIHIAGHDVSLISTPDGRLRSYYVVDGDFHLVANSRRLIERFLEAGAGQKSLAGLAEFADARAAMPLTREDTIFLFASSAFFENLAGPHYRIELDRRLRSIGEMRALKLARLVAQAEDNGATTIDELIAAELLPDGFAQRADGSKLVALERSPSGRGQGEGASLASFRDSLRGDPGWMVSVPDMPIERITQSEARRYAEFRRGLESSVGRFSPISAALKRSESPDEKGLDRITADVRIAPYSQMPIARWPNMLGPAATARVAPIAGDVASLELVVDALGEPVHLFGGLRDFRSPLAVREGEVKADVPASEFIRAYVGGWPRPHLLDRFLGRPAGEFDDDGIARTIGLFDLWLRRADDFFLFSFKRDVLLEVGRQLAMAEAEKPAQIRLRIDDLHDKQIADAVTAFGYSRARDASASGSRFMNSLTTQLHVPPHDARAVAENLIAGRFDCPLGGEYTLVDPFNRDAESAERSARASDDAEQLPSPNAARTLWASTATTPENRFLLTVIPAEYTMPLMNWFRGLTAESARANDELTLHAELDMVHIEVGPPEDPEEAGGLKLPGLGELLGFGKTKDEQVKPASASEPGREGDGK